jgi:murein DD-endopeptidase MepM/ murein hydrolase activator NlpD
MKRRDVDSTRKGLRRFAVVLIAVAAMGASAMAGAWMQSQRVARPVLSTDQERAIADQLSRDSAYVRESVGQLAARVGDLQARLIEMDLLGKRVAKAAGVSYTDPEVQASLEQPAVNVMDDIPSAAGAAQWTAEGLGRRLDTLSAQLSEQKDWMGMLDLVLTRRAGAENGLPSFQPVEYPYLSSSFGWRRHPITGRHVMHEGLDFAAPKGTPIHAASGGVVTEARYVSGYGKMVEINHGNGIVTRYAHASSINVKLGDLVEKGQMIARVGSTGRSTGSHLHFEVRMAGHPLDPTLFLPSQETADRLVADASEQTSGGLSKVR